MKSPRQIEEISEIQKERKKLDLELTLIKNEFGESISKLNEDTKDYIHEVNDDVKDFLLHKVAIPAGIIGVSWLLLKNIKKHRKTVQPSDNEARSSFNRHSATASKTKRTQTSPPVTAQRVVKVDNSPKDRLKKWLPIAIQLAKTGYSYYQNHYANQSESTRSTVLKNNFFNPPPPERAGNPYDRIPEMVKD